MEIKFTKVYRLWHLLTSVSVLGVFITFFMGYDNLTGHWNSVSHNIHTLFIGMLLAAVIVRIYMAIAKINPVPLMHLIYAKSLFSVVLALFYIAMCSALLITLFSNIYLLSVLSLSEASWVLTLRDTTQPIFVILVLLHIAYVLYVNVVVKNQSFDKLIHTRDEK